MREAGHKPGREGENIMKTYCVRFYNDVTKSVFCVMKMSREKFTKRDWNIIVSTLFEEACEGIDNRSLFADVYCCELNDMPPINLPGPYPLGSLTVACETAVDGSTIWAHILANGTHVRTMNIAE